MKLPLNRSESVEEAKKDGEFLPCPLPCPEATVLHSTAGLVSKKESSQDFTISRKQIDEGQWRQRSDLSLNDQHLCDSKVKSEHLNDLCVDTKILSSRLANLNVSQNGELLLDSKLLSDRLSTKLQPKSALDTGYSSVASLSSLSVCEQLNTACELDTVSKPYLSSNNFISKDDDGQPKDDHVYFDIHVDDLTSNPEPLNHVLKPLDKCKPSNTNLNKQLTEKSTHKPIKSGRQILRWNLLFNVLVWMIVSLPIWLPFVSKYYAMYTLPAVQSVFVIMWIVICILASRNMFRIYKFQKSDIDDVEVPVHHLFIISCYKEPVELITRSVQSIANQKHVHNISMTISFEEKTPNLQQKIQKLKDTFDNAGFCRLLFAVHPFGLPNEIPGKCSNSNNGFRESVEVLQRAMGSAFDPESILITTCDADSHFPPNYTSALNSKYLTTKNKHSTIFQAPLFYNWGLDGASFVTRVTGLIRSTLMMGALIPFNINSMSIFSFSLRLCIEGNYVHPAYQMDDIICLIRWMGVTKKRIQICALPVPVLSGPTSGATVELDIIEWARQARRWTIGAAEVFHYFVVKFNRMPTLPALSWGFSFLIYYGILLCSGSLYSLSMTLSMMFLVGDPTVIHSDNTIVPVYIYYWMYALAASQQLCFLVVFILDVFATRALGVKEYICFVRNFFHWILTPFVLLAYSLVELYALHEVAILGKKVCKHGASKKDTLKA